MSNLARDFANCRNVKYLDAVQLGAVNNVDSLYKFGKGAAGAGADVMISPLGTDWTEMTAAAVLKVSSSSANDALAGSGAEKVRIYALDADWKPVIEIVTLNGQTAVNTSKAILHPYRAEVIQSANGANTATNAGIIYIGSGTVTAGVPAVKNLAISAGSNQTLHSFFPVPANTTIINYGLTLSCPRDVAATVTFKAWIKPFGEPYQVKFDHPLYQTSFTHEFYKSVYPAKSLIKITANSSTGTPTVAASFNSMLYKNGISE